MRQLMFVSAGPLIDLILISALFVGLTIMCGSLTEAFTRGVNGIIVFLLFWWTVISAISGLIPHRVNIGGRKLWTDGYWILLLCTASTSRIMEATRGFDSQLALQCLRSGPNPGHLDNLETRPDPDAARAIKQFREQKFRLATRLRPNLTA